MHNVFIGIDSQGDACIYAMFEDIYLQEGDLEPLVEYLQNYLDSKGNTTT